MLKLCMELVKTEVKISWYHYQAWSWTTESANYFMPCCYCISPLDRDKAIEKHQQGAGLVIKGHIYTVYLRLM